MSREQVARVEAYVQALNELEARVDANMAAVLDRSLEGLLGDLRRAYSRYLDAVGPAGADPNGAATRPGAYTTGEASTRFRSLLRIAGEFLPPEDVKAWADQFDADLREATQLGGEAAASLQQLATAAPTAVPFAGANTLAIRSAVQISSAFIQGEGARFRDQIVQIAGEGVARGWGPKRLESKVREALNGAEDPNGITQRVGLKRRAQLIARSELANAYGQGQLDHARAEGFGYVRSIATQDERTCPACAARHGQVYPADRVPAAWHPMCRCTFAPVPNEAVEEPDPAIRDTLLDNEFWRGEYDDVLKTYAQGKGITVEKAQQQLNAALRVPTGTEKYLRPDATRSLSPSVALDAPGGRTFEEAILARERGKLA